MDKKEEEWKCEPCGHVNNSKDAGEVCMICGSSQSKSKIKIVKKHGRQSVTRYKE